MKRQLTALILMLAMGMQGSLVAFAAVAPLMQSDCQSSVYSLAAPHQACCPGGGSHPASCCLDACLAVAAVALPALPASLVSYSRPTPERHFGTANFFSRGDSPLIRPPIL
jgi:hypothetical protein